MHEHALQHLPVLDDGDKLAGMVIERDLLRAALRRKGAATIVGKLMHCDCVSVAADAPVTHAATLMARQAVGGMPVLDRSGQVIGVITETDIFRAFVGVLEARTARDPIVTEKGVSVGAPPSAGRETADRSTKDGRGTFPRRKPLRG